MAVKRILHVQTKFAGDYPLFDDFVLSLDRRRFESVVCFLRGVAENRTRLEREGIETVYLGKKATSERGIKLKRLFRLKDLVKSKQIDLIHSHRHKPTVYAVLASVLSTAIPVVSSVHGKGRTRSRKRRFVNKWLFKRIRRIIAVSNAVRTDILQTNQWLNGERVVTVHNGLDYTRIALASRRPKDEIRKRILPGHESHFWFGTVGRLKPVKNQVRLVQAFAKASLQEPNSILLIAGDGPLKRQLSALVTDLNVGDKVFLLGHRSDVPDILAGLDVFVLPSLSEGLVLSMLEAMASRLPVVASHIDASEEIMNGLECGLLIDPLNVDDICEKILQIRDLDEAARLCMGDRARDRAMEAFTVQRMTTEISNIYNDLLMQDSRRKASSTA